MRFRTAARIVALAGVVLVGAGPGQDAWLGSVRAQAGGRAQAKAEGDARDQDRTAIRATMESFKKAFAAGDAKALTSHWTAEGEYVSEDGGSIQGRDALEKAYAAFFEKNPKPHAESRPESLRFLSRDTAIGEGSVTIQNGSSDPPTHAHYTALLVREDGKWKIAHLSETTEGEDSLAALAWLVGDWKSTGQDTEVMTSYTWNDRKTFLKVHFTIKEKDLTIDGDQFLGKDPASGEIRAWTFEAEGGIGEATWTRDGDKWVVDSVGTLEDGSILTATNILTKVDNDTFTWQSIHRVLGADELPDLPPVKVTRIKPKG